MDEMTYDLGTMVVMEDRLTLKPEGSGSIGPTLHWVIDDCYTQSKTRRSRWNRVRSAVGNLGTARRRAR